jgi:hypothetical protein
VRCHLRPKKPPESYGLFDFDLIVAGIRLLREVNVIFDHRPQPKFWGREDSFMDFPPGRQSLCTTDKDRRTAVHERRWATSMRKFIWPNFAKRRFAVAGFQTPRAETVA